MKKALEEVLSGPVSGPFRDMTDEEVMQAVNKEIDVHRSESRSGSGRKDDSDRAEVEEGMEDYRAGRVTRGVSSLEEEEAEWEALVKSPESQRFLGKMVKEVEEEAAAGRIYDFDPSDPDWKERLEREIAREQQRKK